MNKQNEYKPFISEMIKAINKPKVKKIKKKKL
jgi:hypothetical protein